MLKVITSIEEYTPWSGAVDTWDTIVEHGEKQAFEDLIEEMYPDGIDQTKLNDILWFESNWIYESLGLDYEL